MSPFALSAYIGFGGAVLLFGLSFLARNTGGHQRPLDQLGSAHFAERELSQYESVYNQDPKSAMRALSLKFLVSGIVAFVLEILFG